MGAAAFASFDQPPLSRMLTKRIGRSASEGALGLLGQREEQPALLRAGHQQLARGGGALEGADLAAAQQGWTVSSPSALASGVFASAGLTGARLCGVSGIVRLQSQISVFIGWGFQGGGRWRGRVALLLVVVEQAEELRLRQLAQHAPGSGSGLP